MARAARGACNGTTSRPRPGTRCGRNTGRAGLRPSEPLGSRPRPAGGWCDRGVADWFADHAEVLTRRIAYVARHLDAVQKVIAEGVPVKGHFTWSLLDSYEWSLGYEKRFGLIHVDFNTLDRTPKASYHALAAALVRGGVT